MGNSWWEVSILFSLPPFKFLFHLVPSTSGWAVRGQPRSSGAGAGTLWRWLKSGDPELASPRLETKRG